MADAAPKIDPGADPNAASVVDPKAAPVVDPNTAVIADPKAPAAADPKAVVIDPAAPKSPANDWQMPDDWRDRIGKGNEKLRKELDRFSSFDKYVESTWNLRQRVSAGEFKRPLGENATPEELKVWRAENGVPEKVEDYKLPDKIEVIEIDKPIIAAYLKDALDRNMPQAEAEKNIAFFYQARQQMAQQMYDNDIAHKQEAEDALRATWGADYRGNLNAMQLFVNQTAPKGFYERLLGGRMADGTVVGNDLQALTWLAQLGVSDNEHAAVMSGTSGASADSLNSRITEIETRMKTDRDAYFKDDKMQEEYLKLVRIRERMTQK